MALAPQSASPSRSFWEPARVAPTRIPRSRMGLPKQGILGHADSTRPCPLTRAAMRLRPTPAHPTGASTSAPATPRRPWKRAPIVRTRTPGPPPTPARTTMRRARPTADTTPRDRVMPGTMPARAAEPCKPARWYPPVWRRRPPVSRTRARWAAVERRARQRGRPAPTREGRSATVMATASLA